MTLQDAIAQFLFHCQYEKNLSPKTLKAYSIDLRQFREHLEAELGVTRLDQVDKVALRSYIKGLFGPLAEKSVKRKVATLKSLFRHLEREDEIAANPFRKLDVRIKEKKRLPRTIPLADLERLFRHLYRAKEAAPDREAYSYRTLVRDIAVLEMLFATGARVAEVCNLETEHVDLRRGQARILGKGGRERIRSDEVRHKGGAHPVAASWLEASVSRAPRTLCMASSRLRMRPSMGAGLLRRFRHRPRKERRNLSS